MSNDLDPQFKCLVLFASLSDRSFTKSDLDLKLTVAEIDRLSEETGLLTITRRGASRKLIANQKARTWAGEHLNTNLDGKSKAVRMVLDLVRAKTAAFLKIKQISFAEFVHPDPSTAKLDHPSDISHRSTALAGIRHAYLLLTAGSYDERVLLKRLRAKLTLDRPSQDAALLELLRSGEADFYPEDDPMSRDEEDDNAALQIADRRRHVIYLHKEPRR
jgi:hypothetical protein